MKLGVNIDHIAVLREARKINDPNPLDALGVCKLCNVDQITIHLREDRRHIHDQDAKNIIELSSIPVNLECSINDSIIDIVNTLKPHRATLVPENRAEVTTEGGLDLENNFEQIKKTIDSLHRHEIETSLFIDPDAKSIELASKLGASWIELHTGAFANIYAMLFGGLKNTHHCIKELDLPRLTLQELLDDCILKLKQAALYANSLGLKVAAGHGLNYQNVTLITSIDHVQELNIGQSIIARSVFTGLEKAIKEMQELLK
ncbi:MAG: pyridoxine 5'-phosphate synthase [Campylobacterales bacterium]|nr:pyridoxine 5'-phosphate synthase [Campylobacterales bacterium]